MPPEEPVKRPEFGRQPRPRTRIAFEGVTPPRPDFSGRLPPRPSPVPPPSTAETSNPLLQDTETEPLVQPATVEPQYSEAANDSTFGQQTEISVPLVGSPSESVSDSNLPEQPFSSPSALSDTPTETTFAPPAPSHPQQPVAQPLEFTPPAKKRTLFLQKT